jgi:lipid II:glycine glycyltransferase (peptidoglycan interpeptide bridge formation enzyme)
MKLELTDKLDFDLWEKTLRSLPDGAELLQSCIWAQINSAKTLVHRFAWLEQAKVLVLAQVLETERLGQKSWYLPRGPLCLSSEKASFLWPLVFADLQEQAQQRGVMTISFEPENWGDFQNFSGKIIKPIQPQRSLFLDLSLDEEKLLAQMHPKTRYNIRLAEKKGVLIEQGQGEDILFFWDLLQITTKRDRFRGHGLSHYRRLLEKGSPAIELWLAKRGNKVLAAGVFSFYQGRAVYLHGASADSERQYMAPYLLQWQMIKRAKAFACRYYDFYGIDEKKWPGVTRFKRGFGGEERLYPGTFTLILKPLAYNFYLLAARLRRFLPF